MYVEDLLLKVREHLFYWLYSTPEPFDGLLSTEWHRNFITNVGNHVMAGKQLSTNQAHTVLKLFRQMRHPLIRCGLIHQDDLDRMLHQPEFRQPLYESANVPREVRHLGDNILAFRFKRNDIVASRIRDLGLTCTEDWAGFRTAIQRMIPHPTFNWGHRIWLVPVMRHNIADVVSLINTYRFNTDPAVMAYLRLAKQSRDQPSAFALTEDGVMLANLCDNPLLAGWITEVSDGVVL